MSRVREAVITDLPFILGLVNEFNTKYFDIELDPDKTEDMILHLILNGIVFVSDKGFIGGMAVPDLFRSRTYLQELGWYAKDRSGYYLLKRFIAEAKEFDIDEIRMCTLETSPPEATRLLERVGFVPVERSYRLSIKETDNGSS